MLHKNLQHFIHIATLIGTRIQLTIRIGTCPAFTKAVVGLGVHDPLPVYPCYIPRPGLSWFSSFQHDGFMSACQAVVCSNKSRRARSDKDDRGSMMHVING